MASREVRLGQLERRSSAAPVAPQTVAKASGSKRKRTPEEVKADLLSQIHAYCDSATTVGQLSSMLEAGQVREVQAAVASAKRAHDAQRISSERKRF